MTTNQLTLFIGIISSYDEIAVTQAIATAEKLGYTKCLGALSHYKKSYRENKNTVDEYLTAIRYLMRKSPETTSFTETEEQLVITHIPMSSPTRSLEIPGIDVLHLSPWYDDPMSIELIKKTWAKVYIDVESFRGGYAHIKEELDAWQQHFRNIKSLTPLTYMINGLIKYGNDAYVVLSHLAMFYQQSWRFQISCLTSIDEIIKQINFLAKRDERFTTKEELFDYLLRQLKMGKIDEITMDKTYADWFEKAYTLIMSSDYKNYIQRAEMHNWHTVSAVLDGGTNDYLAYKSVCQVAQILREGHETWLKGCLDES